jgi:NADH dehydrogenase
MKKKIVIIGAGFGGITAVQRLAQSNLFDITIISPKTYFEYYPGLYRILGARTPFEVFVPFRYLLAKNVVFCHDKVTQIDITRKQVITEKNQQFAYDIAIVATGTTPTNFGVEGVFEYGQFVTSFIDARMSKHLLIQKMEEHIVSHREGVFTIAIAGGGPTGVELAGELATMCRSYARHYHYDRKRLVVMLLQRDTVVLPQLPKQVQDIATQRLASIGVAIKTACAIKRVTASAVETKCDVIPYDVFFWTAGSKTSDLVVNTFGPNLSPRKKVVVDHELHAVDSDGMYVLGDNAETGSSGLAQIAEQDGAFVAQMLIAKEKGLPYAPYAPRKPIYVIPIGDYFGILGVSGKVFAGFLPWCLRYLVDARFFFFHLSIKNFIYLSFFRKLK